jgi:uncharacterized protein (TIGR01244 family)
MSKFTTVAAVLALSAITLARQDAIPGIRNFNKIDAAFACGGSTEPSAMAELSKHGFKTVVNLRESSEAGADLGDAQKAADAAGIRFISLPMNQNKPDDATFDRFLGIVRDGSTHPVYFHCATGSRAAALWLVKRMLVDGWPEDKAVHEAVTLGLSSPSLKQYAVGYVQRHKH